MRLMTTLVALSLSTAAIAREDQSSTPLVSSEIVTRDLGSIFFPYIYFEREKVLLDGIDFESTLKIAEIELESGGLDSIITIWAIRDQIVTPVIAARIGELYLKYIDGPGIQGSAHNFAVWHFAWAIGNVYRLGDDAVKAAIQQAYEDALGRPKTLDAPFKAILQSHLTEDRIYMGDAHATGRAYAQSHIVIPGNPLYLQSFDDYKAGFISH